MWFCEPRLYGLLYLGFMQERGSCTIFKPQLDVNCMVCFQFPAFENALQFLDEWGCH